MFKRADFSPLFILPIGGGSLEILPGDVLFVWGNGWIDEAIEHVTHGPSHCALFLDQTSLAEAQGGRETGTTLLSEYKGNNRLEVWNDESLTDEERAQIVSYAKKHFGIHYDYLAIIAELARFEVHLPITSFHEGKRRICSSYVNDCGKSIGRNWATIPYPPAPVDLILSGKLTRKGAIENGE